MGGKSHFPNFTRAGNVNFKIGYSLKSVFVTVDVSVFFFFFLLRSDAVYSDEPEDTHDEF